MAQSILNINNYLEKGHKYSCQKVIKKRKDYIQKAPEVSFIYHNVKNRRDILGSHWTPSA